VGYLPGQLRAALYYVPLYLTAIRRYSSIQINIGLFPPVRLVVPGPILAALAITTIAHGLFLLFDLRGTNWLVFSVALIVFGIGNCMVLCRRYPGCPEGQGFTTAASMYGFMRNIWMVFRSR
jgi:hypothetical protein